MGSAIGTVDENAIRSLCGMFERLEPMVVMNVYQQENGDMEASVEKLLQLAGEPTPPPSQYRATAAQSLQQQQQQQQQFQPIPLQQPPQIQIPSQFIQQQSADQLNHHLPPHQAPEAQPQQPQLQHVAFPSLDDSPSAPPSDDITVTESAQEIEQLRSQVTELTERNAQFASLLDAQARKMDSLGERCRTLEQQLASQQQSMKQATEQYNRDVALATQTGKQAFLHALVSLGLALQQSAAGLSRECADPNVSIADLFSKATSQLVLKQPPSLGMSSLPIQSQVTRIDTAQGVAVVDTASATTPTNSQTQQQQTIPTTPQNASNNKAPNATGGVLDVERERKLAWENEQLRKVKF